MNDELRLKVTAAFDRLLNRTPLWALYHNNDFLDTVVGNSVEELTTLDKDYSTYCDEIEFWMNERNLSISDFTFKPFPIRYMEWDNLFDVFNYLRGQRVEVELTLTEMLSLGKDEFSMMLYNLITDDIA